MIFLLFCSFQYTILFRTYKILTIIGCFLFYAGLVDFYAFYSWMDFFQHTSEQFSPIILLKVLLALWNEMFHHFCLWFVNFVISCCSKVLVCSIHKLFSDYHRSWLNDSNPIIFLSSNIDNIYPTWSILLMKIFPELCTWAFIISSLGVSYHVVWLYSPHLLA